MPGVSGYGRLGDLLELRRERNVDRRDLAAGDVDEAPEPRATPFACAMSRYEPNGTCEKT